MKTKRPQLAIASQPLRRCQPSHSRHGNSESGVKCTRSTMTFPRSSGILLHPTSLPGPHGIGDFGPAAYQFLDFLQASGMHLWQVLPLNPTGYGDSPFQCFSASAGNPLLISLERLQASGVLEAGDLRGLPKWKEGEVEF